MENLSRSAKKTSPSARHSSRLCSVITASWGRGGEGERGRGRGRGRGREGERGERVL